MNEAVENLARLERESRQLRRLEVLIDVVFAIVLWRLFMLIPRPGEGGWNWDSVTAMLASNIVTFVLVAVGVSVDVA